MSMNPASPRFLRTPTIGRSRAASVLALALVLTVAGCGLSRPNDDAAPSAMPLAWPELPAVLPDQLALQVDRDASRVLIQVDAAGPLARLGHSHIIGGSVVEGRVLLGQTLENSALDLQLDVSAFEVDRPDWRAGAGLEPELDAEAVAGTRRNLLGPRVLDAERHPKIGVRATALQRTDQDWTIAARVRLQGRVHAIELPLQLRVEDGALVASGQFERDHAALGLAPFSVAGGALRVADPIRIQFRIVAVGQPGDIAIIQKLINPPTGLQ